DLEHLSDKSARCPVCHRYETAGLADSLEFCRDEIRTRSEHCSKHRHYHVETAVGVRQRFGVALVKLRLQSFALRVFARLLDEVRRNIDPRYIGARPGGRDRQIPGAARDIEYFHSRFQVEPLYKIFSLIRVIPRDLAEISGDPGCSKLRFQRGQFRSCSTLHFKLPSFNKTSAD